MNLDYIRNIRGINVVEKIEKSILNVRGELKGLNKTQMCLVYSSYLLEEMKKNHLQVRLINTLDLGFSYEHYFILILGDNKYYIADLTYEQFNSLDFNILKDKGYMNVDDSLLNKYLSIIERKEVNGFTCDDLFYMEIDENRRK